MCQVLVQVHALEYDVQGRSELSVLVDVGVCVLPAEAPAAFVEGGRGAPRGTDCAGCAYGKKHGALLLLAAQTDRERVGVSPSLWQKLSVCRSMVICQ